MHYFSAVLGKLLTEMQIGSWQSSSMASNTEWELQWPDQIRQWIQLRYQDFFEKGNFGEDSSGKF